MFLLSSFLINLISSFKIVNRYKMYYEDILDEYDFRF